MSYTLNSIAGSTLTAIGSTISLNNGGNPGALLIYNGSLTACLINDQLGNMRFLPAMTADRVDISQGAASIIISKIYSVTGSASNPDTISFVVLNATEAANDRHAWPAPLGASLGLTALESLQNDGNPAGTQVIEATASGDVTSDVVLTNDGKLTLARTLTVKGASSLDNGKLTTDGAGTITAVAYAGPIKIDVEGGITVIRPQPTTDPVILQVNGVNWNFETTGKTSFPAAIESVAAQATVGTFGVPVIVAQALRTLVNTTNTTTILTYAVPASGIYRINGYVAFNGTNSPAPIFTYQHTDPDTSNVLTPKLVAASNNSTAVIQLGGTAQNQSQFNDALTATFAAKSGTNVTVQYQNTTATPADYVTVILERLA